MPHISLDRDTERYYLSFQEAADYLNVSIEWIEKLLKEGELKSIDDYYKFIPLADVISYKVLSRMKSEQLMDELVADAQAWGMYD